MTISFSGLASGLDTSSWVQSLTALKQAKVTQLEEKKESVLLSQETLNNIKSFFSSFRALLEKVTDTKFNLPATDLFAQNLATSADISKITATATTEAQEAVYDLTVNKLATNTQAISGFSYQTTIIETTTAALDSKLENLGVKPGDITVKVDGIDRGLNINKDDTIKSFIEKLKDIGVGAQYNEKTGVFTMNVSANGINDIGRTNIVNALQLAGVNEGYTTNELLTERDKTVINAATGSTKLSELGVKAGTVKIEANENLYSYNINANTTFDQFISMLRANNIDANLDKDGIFTINDAFITDDGTTEMKKVFGLEEKDVYEVTQTSNQLSYQTTIVNTTVATISTKLNDLGANIAGNQTVIITDSNNNTKTITVNSTSTIGTLITGLNNAGLAADISKDGIVTISGGRITGGTFDAIKVLGLNSEPFTAMVTGNPLTETIETFDPVTLETKLVDDLKVSEGYLEVKDTKGKKQYLKIYSGQTIADLITDLSNYGIYSSLDAETAVLSITGGEFKTLSDADVNALIANGTIRETDARYRHGTNLLTLLYGASSISVAQTSVASTAAKSAALRYTVTNTISATKSTTLGNLGLSGTQNVVFDVRGESRTISVNNAMTIEGLLTAFKNAGISADFDETHSTLSIENAYITSSTAAGTLGGVLGLVKTVSGKYISSNNLYTTVDQKATLDSVISNFVTLPSNKNIIIHDVDGVNIGTVSVTNTTTFEELFNALDDFGIQSSIEDGIITFTSNDGKYLSGDLLTTLGISTVTKTITVTTTTGTSQTSGALSYTEDKTAQIGDKISAFTNANGTVTVKNAAGTDIGTVTIDGNTTFEGLFKALDNLGIQGTMENGIITLTSNNGAYATGTPLTALGITTDTKTTTITTTVGLSGTSTTLKYSTTKIAGLDDNISDYLSGDYSHTQLNFFAPADPANTNNPYTQYDSTIITPSTFRNLFNILDDFGIQGTMEDGVITLTSSVGSYVTGDLISALGIGINTIYIQKTVGMAISSATQRSYNSIRFDTTTYSYETVFTTTSSFDTIVTQSTSGTATVTINTSASTVVTITTTGVRTVTITTTETATVTAQASSTITITNSQTISAPVTKDTLLSDLGIEVGDMLMPSIMVNGFYINLPGCSVTEDMTTIGDCLDAFKNFWNNNIANNGGSEFNYTIENGKLKCSFTLGSIEIQNYKLSGAVAEKLGIAGIAFTHRDTITAPTTSDPLDITWKDAGIFSGSPLDLIAQDKNKTRIGTFINENDKMSDLILLNGTPVSFSLRSDKTLTLVDNNGNEWAIDPNCGLGKALGIKWGSDSSNYATSNKAFYTIITCNSSGTTTVNDWLASIGQGTAGHFNLEFDGSDGSLTKYISGDMAIESLFEVGAGCYWDYDIVTHGDKKIILFYGLTDETWTITADAGHGGVDFFKQLFMCENISPSYQVYGSQTSNTLTLSATTTPGKYEIWDEWELPKVPTVTEITQTITTSATATETVTVTASGTVVVTVTETGTQTITLNATGTATVTINQTATTTISQTNTISMTRTCTATTTTPVTLTELMTLESSFAQLGLPALTTQQYIKGVHEGQAFSISIDSTNTVWDMVSALGGYGISAIMQDGIAYITGTEDGYITDMTSGVKTALGITSRDYYDVSDIERVSNTLSKRVEKTPVQWEMLPMADYTTKYKDIKLPDSWTTPLEGASIVGVCHGETFSVTPTSEQTLGDIFTELAAFGISCSINNGIITITCANDSYIYNMNSIFGITGFDGRNKYYTRITSTTVSGFNSLSNQQLHNVTMTANGASTIGRISKTGTISGVYHGGTFTVTASARKTIGDVLAELAGYGISGSIENGVVKLTGTNEGYITNAGGAFGITGSAYTTSTSTTVSGFNSLSNQQQHNVTMTANGASTIGQINKAGTISGVYQGRAFTVTASAGKTIGDVLAELAGYGISGSIVNGVIKLTGTNDGYITNAGGAFGITGSAYTTSTTTTVSGFNSLSNQQHHTVTITANGNSTIGQINKAGTISGVYQGRAFTVTASAGKTIGDVLAELAGFGISGSIVNGVIKLTGTNDGYITNAGGAFGITGSAYTTSTTTTVSGYNTNSNEQHRTITEYLKDETKISQITNSSGVNLGITAGQIYAYQDGTRYVVNIDTNDTIETLNAKLSQYGISVSRSSDGKLYFDGTNDSYLTTAGLSSYSNILSKIGVSGDWNTRYDSESQKLKYNTTSNNVINGSTKLSKLNDTSGNALNISSGEYTIYQNGVWTTETITSDTTVDDLIATLGSYGMIANINSDGAIEIGAYNNTYLATSASAGANTNMVSRLFAAWDFTNIYTSNHLEIPHDVIRAVNAGTKLADINEGTYQDGYISVVKDGVQTNISLTADDTLGTLMDELKVFGFESVINDKGQLILHNYGNSSLLNYTGTEKKSNVLDILGIGGVKWISTNSYESETVQVVTTKVENTAMVRDSLLSEIGITTGEYNIFKNGVKFTALISSDETLGSFIDTLAQFGIESNIVNNGTSSILKITGLGDTYIAKSKSTNTGNVSNIVDILFPNDSVNKDISYKYSGELTTSHIEKVYSHATEETLLSEFDTASQKAEGMLSVTVDGVKNTINITAADTIGSLLDKFRALGLEATITNGEIMVQSGYKDFKINTGESTSKIVTTMGFAYNADLGGYSASIDTCEATTTTIEDKTISSANYADYNTTLSMLNISSGTLSVYKNGQKAIINIDANQTFGDLRAKVNAVLDKKMDVVFENGYLKFYATDGASVEVGSTTDTSNFSAICGLSNDKSGVVKSSRELYKVNNSSVITETGLFRKKDVKAGTFTVGTHEFTIDSTTTLGNIISQINASDDTNATAYWDSIDGKLVIKSRTTGSSFINIEAGTSNFTDVMGYTNSEWETDGSVKVTRMDINTQELGENARFTINGTAFSATSNTISSDVSRIQGVTINLKDITEGETVKLTIEKDKESVANAVSDIVDAYNELIENIDKEIAVGGHLQKETTLKLIRNQIRTLMTSSLAGSSVFKNLDAIGISADKASAANLSVSTVNKLKFDKDKFFKAFETDLDALKELLVGTDAKKGVFLQIENIVESALSGASGYFDAADRSYQKQIQRLNTKIKKQTAAVEKYKQRLETKFAAMDILIANMQNQYSSFLSM